MTTSKEFLYELAQELRYLPARQVNEVLKHYRDKINVEIDYGVPEEKIIKSLKSPEEIAKAIYESHGIDYLRKRKAQAKFTNILKIGFFSIVILLTALLFISSTIFVGNILVNMVTLLINAFSFKKAIDVVVSFLLILAYLFTTLIAFIYIIDLFIIIINSMLAKILYLFEKNQNKEFAFLDFTITGSFHKLIKKEKILSKILIACAILTFVFGVCSYLTKGYMYRSMNNINSLAKISEVEESFEKINVLGNNAYVIIKTEDIEKPKLEFEYEFTNYKKEIKDQTLEIFVENPKSYDLLGLLKSPVPLIRITIPKSFDTKNLDINVNYGKIIFDKATLNTNVNIKTISAQISLNENSITTLNILSDASNIKSKSNIVDSLKLTQKRGSFNSEKDTTRKFLHDNGSSSVTVLDAKCENYDFTNASGSVYFEKIQGEKINFSSFTSLNELYDIYYDKADFLIQATGSLSIERAIFNEYLNVTNKSESHQVLSYISSPLIKLQGVTGQIYVEKLNATVGDDIINNTEDEFKDSIRNYNQKIKMNQFNINLEIDSNKTNVSILDSEISKLKITSKNASVAIQNIASSIDEYLKNKKQDFKVLSSNLTEEITFDLYDTALDAKNIYSKVINFNLDSSSYNARSIVDVINDKLIEDENLQKINLTKDGWSDFTYSKTIEVILNDTKN